MRSLHYLNGGPFLHFQLNRIDDQVGYEGTVTNEVEPESPQRITLADRLHIPNPLCYSGFAVERSSVRDGRRAAGFSPSRKKG